MPYKSLADLMLSMEPKRHIKSKKKRIRKKYQYKDFWLKKRKEEHRCLYCDREYRAYDSDADTPKEQFCTEECYHNFERDLDIYLASKEEEEK